MDIAKYIGLFLLKNNFCYIHGLGNLELKRKPAAYNGDALIPPGYDVTLSPSGSIDDNLANFIASNEQISISKASNALRDFSTQARADIAAGKSVGIPAIGTFYEDEGKIRFATDPNLRYTPPPIKVAKVNKSIEQNPVLPVSIKTETSGSNRPYVPVHTPSEEEDDDVPKLNWTRIILVGVIVLALAAIATYGIKRYKGGEDALQPVIQNKENTVPATPIDTSTVDSTGGAPTVRVDGAMIQFKAIIDSYPTRAKAEKRQRTMRGYGYDVEVIAEDSTKYFVVMPIMCPVADTGKILDSLTRMYNPAGVTIY